MDIICSETFQGRHFPVIRPSGLWLITVRSSWRTGAIPNRTRWGWQENRAKESTLLSCAYGSFFSTRLLLWWLNQKAGFSYADWSEQSNGVSNHFFIQKAFKIFAFYLTGRPLKRFFFKNSNQTPRELDSQYKNSILFLFPRSPLRKCRFIVSIFIF